MAAVEGARFAASLAATALGLSFVILTTSSIVVIPQLLYMLAGLGVSCARLYLPRPTGLWSATIILAGQDS